MHVRLPAYSNVILVPVFIDQQQQILKPLVRAATVEATCFSCSLHGPYEHIFFGAFILFGNGKHTKLMSFAEDDIAV